MISALISRLVILLFGTLYPAYSSYKAVKTKDIKLYVKWMMYWIVFALFISIETFTDIFLSFWFPFYYELKVILVIWLLSPVTRGSSIMYRRVIHPLFMRREQEIDELIAKAKEQGYSVILDIGCKGMSLATNAIMSTAVKNVPAVMVQSPTRSFFQGNDQTDGPIADSAVDSTLIFSQSDGELDLTSMEESSYSNKEQETVVMSESEEEYFSPPKKTRRGRPRKRDASTSSTRVTRSSKKKGGSGLLFQLKKSYSLNDLNTANLKPEKLNFATEDRYDDPDQSRAMKTSSPTENDILYFESMKTETDGRDSRNGPSNGRTRRSTRQISSSSKANGTLPRRRQTKKRTI